MRFTGGLTIGKKKTTTTQSNKYEYIPQPKNPFFDSAKTNYDNYDESTGVKQTFGRLRNEINESGNEFFGASTSPELREKTRMNRLFSATMNEGRALSDANRNENAVKSGGYMSLGEATKSPLVQTGGTTTQVTPFNWGSLLSAGIQGGASVGSAAIGNMPVGA